MKCEFCKGQGTFYIVSYSLDGHKVIALPEHEQEEEDCPKCMGSGEVKQ